MRIIKILSAWTISDAFTHLVVVLAAIYCAIAIGVAVMA